MQYQLIMSQSSQVIPLVISRFLNLFNSRLHEMIWSKILWGLREILRSPSEDWTTSTAVVIWTGLVTSNCTRWSSFEQLLFNCCAPSQSTFKQPANTWKPWLSNSFAKRLPNPVSQPNDMHKQIIIQIYFITTSSDEHSSRITILSITNLIPMQRASNL